MPRPDSAVIACSMRPAPASSGGSGLSSSSPVAWPRTRTPPDHRRERRGRVIENGPAGRLLVRCRSLAGDERPGRQRIRVRHGLEIATLDDVRARACTRKRPRSSSVCRASAGSAPRRPAGSGSGQLVDALRTLAQLHHGPVRPIAPGRVPGPGAVDQRRPSGRAVRNRGRVTVRCPIPAATGRKARRQESRKQGIRGTSTMLSFPLSAGMNDNGRQRGSWG